MSVGVSYAVRIIKNNIGGGTEVSVSAQPFRFSLLLNDPCSRRELTKKGRYGEELGYGVLLVSDDLRMPTPFVSALMLADTTARVRVGTFDVDTSYHHPTLLAREVAGVDQLTDGRLQVGLGARSTNDEFKRTGVISAGDDEGVDSVEHTIRDLDRILRDPGHRPAALQSPRPPLSVAASGGRMLRVAAAHADIVSDNASIPNAPCRGTGTLAQLANRADYVRTAGRKRSTNVEYDLAFETVTITDRPHANIRCVTSPPSSSS